MKGRGMNIHHLGLEKGFASNARFEPGEFVKMLVIDEHM